MFHQFYFTHCTYASSALERKSGEVGPHPLGYSVRSASVQGSALREIFRRLERFVYYYLPTDTPAQEKEAATDANSPKRLVFLPETDFGPVLMQLAYRPKDTAGRIGSYFCHVLTGDEKALEKIVTTSGKMGSGPVPPAPPVPPSTKVPPTAGSSTLTVHSALQLWNAAEWVSKDEEWFPHDIQPFDSLQNVLKGNSPAIDDRVLASFLTTEPDGTFYDPKKVIPARWRKMLVTERQQIFKTILYGFLLTHDQPTENLLLVVEPGMAAFLFYGISQFFPQSLFRTQSFSTYEPLPDRLLTKLAATTFYSPETNDLNDALYHSRSFVLNTWNGRTSNFDAANLPTSYVAHVWKQFLAGGLAQVKTFCTTFNSVGLTTMNDLKALMDVENVYHQIMLDDESSISNRQPVPEKLADLPLSSSRTAVTLLKRRIADGLTKIMAQPLPEAEKALKNVIGTPGQLLLLELLGTGGNLPNVQNAVKFLTDSLPLEFLGRWLKSSQASDEYKGKLLEKWFLQLHTMPKGCEFLWKISVESLKSGSVAGQKAGSVPGQKPPVPNANVLPETLLRLPLDVLWDAFQSAAVVPFQKEMVLAYTLGVSRLVERDGALSESVMAVRKRLDLFIQRVPESLFGAIYRAFGNWFFLNYPGDSLFLGEKFAKLEETIFLKPAEISAKLEILFDIQDILPDRVLPRIKRWRALQKAAQAVTNFQAQPGKKFQFRVLDQACEALAQAAYEVFDDVRFLAACGGPEAPEFAKIGKINNAQRNRLVAQELAILPELFRQWFNVDFLPVGNKSHELLQKKLKFYLQTKEWKTGGVSAFGSKALIFAILGGIAGGLLLVFLFLFLVSGKPSATPDDVQPSQFMNAEKSSQNLDSEEEEEKTDSSKSSKGKRNSANKKKTSRTVAQKNDSKVEEAEEEFSNSASSKGKKSAEPEETTYTPETDDESTQLADAEETENGESTDENPNENPTDEELADDGEVLNEPQLPGKRFQQTKPELLEKWDKKLAEDGFSRFVKLELVPSRAVKARPDRVALNTNEPSNRWFVNDSQVAGLKLERGYVLFEGTAYPFGESNCVSTPVPEQGMNTESETVTETTGNDFAVGAGSASNSQTNVQTKPKTGKHVLTEEKAARTNSDDVPGIRYSVPDLAEALGLKKVYVELEGEFLTIHVQKNEQTDAEIDALLEEFQKQKEELNQLIQTMELCARQGTASAQKQANFNVLAELVGKRIFKNRPEKQADILEVATRKKEQLEKQLELKMRNLPAKESVWTSNEEDLVRRLQGREMRYFPQTTEAPAPPEIAAVFSGNFFYNLPLPVGVQNFMIKNAGKKKSSLVDENLDSPQNRPMIQEEEEEESTETLESVETTEELADLVYNRLEDGFQEFADAPEETARLYIMVPAYTEKDLKEAKDVFIEKTFSKVKQTQNSVRFLIVGKRKPSNLYITARIREIIPGNSETKDREAGAISSETEPFVLSDESAYVLISFRIQDQNATDLSQAKTYVTPYFLLRLNHDEEQIPREFLLSIQFSQKFIGKFISETMGSKASSEERLSNPQKGRNHSRK